MPPRFIPTRLVDYPWVVVRISCPFCKRSGSYRLARLAAKYGPEQSLDGLLRDLAHDCPWYNERPRKYEPRCGTCFVDLERHFPPADHPDEPIYRQRGPEREQVAKRSVGDRFPVIYQGGAPALSNWPDAEVLLTCGMCGRREVFIVADLGVSLGADTLMTNVRIRLTAECPRRKAQSVYEQCGALLIRLEPRTLKPT